MKELRMDNDDRKNKLARRVLELTRNTLTMNLRFMDTAFNALGLASFESSFGPGFICDGRRVYYQVDDVLQKYSVSPEIINRSYLHMVLHLIFRHYDVRDDIDTKVWDLATDIYVEYVISNIGMSIFETKEAGVNKKLSEIVFNQIIEASAQKIYNLFLSDPTLFDKLNSQKDLFTVDDHSLWYDTYLAGSSEADGDSKEESDDLSSLNDLTKDGSPTIDGSDDGMRASDTNILSTKHIQNKELWDNMSTKLEQTSSIFGIDQSSSMTDTLIESLSYIERHHLSYSEFLKRFAVPGETLTINDDEFDYIYYTYGLKLYENMPLIEPLEYREDNRIRDFVIAIDTSSSTIDGLVRKFIERTYSILCEEASFFTEINLLIVQCDAGITDVAHLTKLKEVEDYLEYLEIKGLGGTDFRPVFDLVERYLDEGFFHDLGGLIYFTDGQGTYPAKKPAFETAFAFVEDTAVFAEVPSWAMKVTLEERAFVDEA